MTTNEEKINLEDIDGLHEAPIPKVTITDKDIYKIIFSNPLLYLYANGYLKKFFIATICPFVIGLVLFNYISELEFVTKYIELVFVLFLLWVWFNKNTCYVIIKLLMLVYSVFPYGNIIYLSTGRWIPVKFIRWMLGIIFTLISLQIIYQVFTG